jgi:hypothetical protein
MPPGLRGRNLLLNARLPQLRFGQGQTQIGDIMEIIWPDDLHDISASRLTLYPRFHPPQRPPHHYPPASE